MLLSIVVGISFFPTAEVSASTRPLQYHPLESERIARAFSPPASATGGRRRVASSASPTGEGAAVRLFATWGIH